MKLTSHIFNHSSGRTMKQGFVTYPLCEIRLEESEIARQCASCHNNERVGDSRYMRCSTCKKVYYCSSEVRQSTSSLYEL